MREAYHYINISLSPEILRLGVMRDEVISVGILKPKSSRPLFAVSLSIRFRGLHFSRLKVFWLHQLVFVRSLPHGYHHS